MKDIKYYVVLAIVLIAICMAGKVDYNETIIYNISQETYDALKDKLGEVSDSELVDTYMANKEYWDNFKY